MQIAFLASFLTAGVLVLQFDVPFYQPPLIIGTACLTQWACTRAMKVPPAGYLSPLISGLGLSILLRADAWWVGPAAAVIAISSKFLVRVRGKHVFNPTNIGLVVVMLVTTHAWCSPSQWGTRLVLVAWFAVFGLAVAHRSFRADVSLAFLGTWVLLKTARVLYLGAPMSTLTHQLMTGGLIVFTFFMISDPKTTPDHRGARIGYGMAVAALGFFFLHQLWWQNALLYALVTLAPLVPLLDWFARSEKFSWPSTLTRKEVSACSDVSSVPASPPV